MSDLLDRLRLGVGDRYQIEHELGSGGMAIVYRAVDRRLKRRVAIKVLRPELAGPLGAERFLREIETTANLRHPHILPLFDTGQVESADGRLPYYVMPWVDGESLRQRLDRERRLPVDEAIRIAREVAQALGAAHQAGVVHRDVKPENILLDGGHAVVADFGIARAVTALSGSRLTATGMAIGTPAYMSPEQSVGEPAIDGRSDLYSLASVLYEMLAGEPPYTGPTAQAVIAKRLSAPAPDITTVRPTVPPGVARALTRALATSAADRPATASDFLAALDGGDDAPRGRVIWTRRRFRLRAGRVAGLALVLALAAGAALVWRARALEPRLVAVLPFRNVGSPAEQYFADGLTEEIATRLSTVRELDVMAPTATARYRDDSVPATTIGREVGAPYLLAGLVQWASGAGQRARIRITTRLIRTRDAQQLWAASFDAGLEDVFALQGRIAGQVAEALGVTLGAGDRTRLARRPTLNVAAYDRVLRGNFLLARRTPDAVERAIREYDSALAIDPGYADALAKIGYAYTLFTDWGWAFQGLAPGELRARALGFANRALAVDSTSAAGWLTRGYVLTQEDPYHLRDALPAFERALALDSTTAEGWYQYGQALMVLGRDSAAMAAYRRAFHLDPDRPMALMSLAAVYRKNGQPRRARQIIDSAVLASRTVTSPYVRVMRGIMALEAGDRRQARSEAELALALDSGYAVPARSLLARTLVAEGDTVAAAVQVHRILASLDPDGPSPNAVLYASTALLALARDSQALDVIERARPRGAQLWFYLRNPEFTRLAGTPRFDRILAEADPRPPGPNAR